jgi:CheY-like chemotaxis protein
MSDDPRTVLVVDDEPEARDFLMTVLADNGFTAIPARDGNEAIDILEHDRPDLVTLDITMPEKSGVAVYRRLREDAVFRDIPVIIITGISDEFQKFISSRKHVPPPDGYISKPVDHAQFLAMVRRLLGQEKAAAPPATGA